MKKGRVKDKIEERRSFIKKELSLKGEDVLAIERDTYYEDTICGKPIKIIRLREPTVEAIGEEVITFPDGMQQPFQGFRTTDNGFLDNEGYIWLRIKPDVPRYILHYFFDRCLDSFPTYPLPATDHRTKERFRAQWTRDLEVYRLRAFKNSYEKIGVMLGIKPDAARKAFRRAYEIIHGVPYKGGGGKVKVEKAYLGKKDCPTCPERPSCKKLCPEMEAYANQDKVGPYPSFVLNPDFVHDLFREAPPAKGKGRQDTD